MTKSLKTYCLACALTAAAGLAQGQDLNSGYFIQDYKYRHQMNPAFGNDQNYVAIPILGNVNMRMQGNFGLGDILFQNPANGKYEYTFMHPDVSVSDALSGFSKGKNRISADLGLTILSGGFKAFGGYNTIELRSRTSMGGVLPYELFEFAKNLRNKDYEFDNIRVNAVSFAELAFGHSHQINDRWRVGGKVKLLFGLGRANVKIDGMTASFTGNTWLLNSGDAKAEVNMKGIEFKNTTDEYRLGGTYEHVDLGSTDISKFGLSGMGLGIDLGAEYEILDGLKASAALVDLGFISWKNNMLLRQKSGTFTFNGFHDLKLKSEATNGTSFDDQMDGYADQFSNFVNFENLGDQGGTSSALAATLNLGVEYALPCYKPMAFGLLFQQHFAGAFSWTEGRLSANWTPLKWLDGGVNVAVNTFTTSAGWIVNIHPKGFNIFLGMDHILGKQTKEFIPLNSNMQFSLGMNVAWGGGAKKSKDTVEKTKTAKKGKAKKDEQSEKLPW